MPQKTLVYVLVGIVALLMGILVAFPSAIGASTLLPFVYAAAFRTVVAIGLVGLGLALLTVLILSRARRSARTRPAPLGRTGMGRRLTTLVAIVLTCCGLASLAVVATRGWAAAADPAEFRGADLVVLNANTLEAATSARDIAALALRYDADVIAVQEVTSVYAEEVATLLAADDRQFTVSMDSATDAVGNHRSALLTPRAWPAPTELASVYGTARLTTGETTVASVHTVSPLSASVTDGSWRASVEETAAQCPANRGSILAGDFNATLDHAPLRARGSCRDAAQALGMAGLGTWRSDVPGALASGIDHQLFDPEAWRPVAGAYLPLPGSDHDGLVVAYSAET